MSAAVRLEYNCRRKAAVQMRQQKFLGCKIIKKTYYYARVFSSTQDVSIQMTALIGAGAKRKEIISDGVTHRDSLCPEYQKMKERMHPGDVLVIKSLYAIGRNRQRIRRELTYYKKSHIQVRVLEIPTTCFDPKPGQEWALNMVYDTIIQMLKPQNEREIGIKKEKKIPKLPTEKVSLGKRGRNQFIANEQELRMLYDQYLKRNISKSEIARRYGISRVTLDKLLKRTGIGAD